MWRRNITTVSLVVFGVLLIAVVAPNSKWGWNAQDHVAAPMVNASWTQNESATRGHSGPTQVTVAPPYIILETQPGLVQQSNDLGQIRISIQAMSGSYSEYVASSPSAQVARPVLYIGSVKPETHGRPWLNITVWE